ncbi:maleylpyruvate isomerase family mycothiol-dependent enzyme [Nocardiopsis sp. LOL_012]|uniref:maleylpyruvate isomerase family mycothiol-dependent enzyme n=1 Tax=Nocardiopsis sp. LOL_012 TaxID=3345409 RepID=UPI003A8C2B3D
MNRQDSAAVWRAVHAERAALIQDLADLAPQRWETASLCRGWTVHDVVAHLVDGAKTTRLGFARQLIAARFDFDRGTAVGVERERAGDPADTLAAFRDVAGMTATPPASLATRLVEAFVHGEDIRRPLGLHRDYPSQPVLAAVRYQVRTPVGFGGGKERARGLCLRAGGADAPIGTGQDVHGSPIALLLALSGRPTREGEISGPGAASLTGR